MAGGEGFQLMQTAADRYSGHENYLTTASVFIMRLLSAVHRWSYVLLAPVEVSCTKKLSRVLLFASVYVLSAAGHSHTRIILRMHTEYHFVLLLYEYNT